MYNFLFKKYEKNMIQYHEYTSPIFYYESINILRVRIN